jgi:hypothetical protein
MKYEEIEKLFEEAGKINFHDRNNSFISINENLKLMITSFKTTNSSETKKSLKEFLKFLFVYFTEKTQTLIEAVILVKLFGENFINLCTLFPEKLNSEMKLFLEELEIICKNDIDIDTNNNIQQFLNDMTKVKKFIILSILIGYLTTGLSNTNQILTNYMVIISMLNSRINLFDSEIKILIKIHFIDTLSIITQNTKTYNPDLIISLEKAVNFLKLKISNAITNNNLILNFQTEYYNYNSDNYFQFAILKLLDNHISHKVDSESLNFSIVMSRILNNITNLIILYKDDINFQTIFKGIVDSLKDSEIKNNQNCNLSSKFNIIIELYERYSQSNNLKKNIEINFMKLKKKSIIELEPDIEPIFLGKSFLVLNKSDKEKKEKAIARKIKSTKKQAIRNLKNEAKIIDIQRQKKLQHIDDRRKEDIRASNQFIEQQNIEYKKMITSQGSKRFKIKRGRGQMRGGKTQIK